MKRSRALLAALPLALVATLLTSCSGGSSVDGPTADASGASCLAAGSASDAVKVDGDFGAELTLTSKLPVNTASIERTVLIAGDGEVYPADEQASVTATFFNGETGQLINHIEAVPMANNQQNYLGSEWMYDAVRCGQSGQRVAFVVPAAEALGGQDPAAIGLSADSSLVAVFDFLETTKCDAVIPRDEDYPQVDPGDGTSGPTITIPECMAAPTELEVKVLVEGTGETVEPGDSVTVNYRGVIWRTGEEFDSSWSRGQAATFSTTGVIGGFQKALEGQKVGSQIMAVVPAPQEKGGYGPEGLMQRGFQPDDVMVFVLDIISTSR